MQISQHTPVNVSVASRDHGGRGEWGGQVCGGVTLDLRLVHHKELVIPAVLELLALAAVQAHVLVLRLVQGEEGRWVSAVTSVS